MCERKEGRKKRKEGKIGTEGKKEDKTRGREESKREVENKRGKREFQADSQSLWSEPTGRMELPSTDTEKTAGKTKSLGVGDGKPVQCCCLENSMDRGI